MKLTIDFDNTCALEDFPLVGKDVPFAVETLKELVDNGHKLILWTCRSGEQLEDAVKWFNNHDIDLFGVNDDPEPNEYLAKTYGIPRKVLGNFSIDDKNLGTPTIIYTDKETNKSYRVVNWVVMRQLLRKEGIL